MSDSAATPHPELPIAIVVRPASGGIRRHVTQLLEGLDRRHFVPTLYAPQAFTLDTPIPGLQRRDAEIHAVTRPWSDVRSAHALKRHFMADRPIVHAHGLRAALVAGFAARMTPCPFIFTAHNPAPARSPLTRLIVTAVGSQAARVIAVSEAVRQTLTRAGIAGEKIVVIPNGIDLYAFDRTEDSAAFRATLGLAADTPIVAAVGRLSPEKGFDILIRAMTIVRDRLPSAVLLLAGGGAEENALRRLAVETRARVEFLGGLSDIRPLLAAADIVAIPSRSEGQGIVALEAMAARKPVIAAHVGGLPETVLERETGILVEAENPAALAAGMLELFADPHRRHVYGAAGRSRVEAHFTIASMIEQIEGIYAEIGNTGAVTSR